MDSNGNDQSGTGIYQGGTGNAGQGTIGPGAAAGVCGVHFAHELTDQ